MLFTELNQEDYQIAVSGIMKEKLEECNLSVPLNEDNVNELNLGTKRKKRKNAKHHQQDDPNSIKADVPPVEVVKEENCTTDCPQITVCCLFLQQIKDMYEDVYHMIFCVLKQFYSAPKLLTFIVQQPWPFSTSYWTMYLVSLFVIFLLNKVFSCWQPIE